MSSVFTWIDHSEAERRRMLDAIELFRERGTRDELGLSTIRDGFSDLMFPGTGSLQSRARYFFFVSWMYQILEAEGVRSADIARKARQFEVKLINALAESDDIDGVIGIQKRASLQRLPSSIYWNGLKRLGVRLFDGSQEEYHRSFDNWHVRRRRSLRNDDGEIVGSVQLNWRPGIPEPPDTFPDVGSFRMSSGEAEYLAERIVSEHPTSLLAFFVDRLESESETDYVWDHSLFQHLPQSLRQQVSHARNFAEVMHGAAIMYNIMLAEAEPRREALLPDLEALFDSWRADVIARRSDLRAWSRAEFWQLLYQAGTVPTAPTHDFVDAWIDMVLTADDVAGLRRSESARRLIADRELRLKKRALARLHNPSARERWNGNAGLGRLEYRWRNAQTLLNDMLQARRSHAGAQ
jgi:Family of unknown function (DUF6361)